MSRARRARQRNLISTESRVQGKACSAEERATAWEVQVRPGVSVGGVQRGRCADVPVCRSVPVPVALSVSVSVCESGADSVCSTRAHAARTPRAGGRLRVCVGLLLWRGVLCPPCPKRGLDVVHPATPPHPKSAHPTNKPTLPPAHSSPAPSTHPPLRSWRCAQLGSVSALRLLLHRHAENTRLVGGGDDGLG